MISENLINNYKIIARNTSIIITNYELGDNQYLESQFTVWDPLCHCGSHLGMWYDAENKLLYLPRGIDLWFVEQCFKCKAYIDRSSDEYENIGNCKLKVGPRDDVQKEALRFTLGVGEYRGNKDIPQESVNLSTGKGKTYISIATISYFERRSIIITYAVTWLHQWKEKILEYTGLDKKEILLISGAASINKLLKSKPEDLERYKMFLITHSTINSYASKNGWEAIGELFRHLKIGLKIYDEAHLNFLNMSLIDFYTNTDKTYYLTATPARSSQEENEIYGRYFKNVPSVELFNKEDDPHTKYIAIRFNSQPTIFDVRECRNMYGLDRNKYMEYFSNTKVYYKLLTVLMDIALKQNGKVLIYIGTNATILKTKRWIEAHYPELWGQVGIFTTLVSKEQKEIEKDKRIILSTTKSAGAAMDIKGLKMTIVFNEPFKSLVTAQQSLGRTRDANTFYIDCVDVGFKKIKEYYSYKKQIFEKYALSCSEISLNETELDMRYEKIIGERMTSFRMNMVTYDKPFVPFVTFSKPQSLVTFDNNLE